MFAQFHKEATKEMKAHVISEICKPCSKLRVTYATVALGNGLDAPNIRHVIHYKPPTSIEKYFHAGNWQSRTGWKASKRQPCTLTILISAKTVLE